MLFSTAPLTPPPQGWIWKSDDPSVSGHAVTPLLQESGLTPTVVLDRGLVPLKDGEEVLAVHGTRPSASTLDVVMTVLTAGFFWCFEVRHKRRHEQAIVLTDRRLISTQLAIGNTQAAVHDRLAVSHLRTEIWWVGEGVQLRLWRAALCNLPLASFIPVP